MPDPRPASNALGPLHGIRVLEFTQIVAGPVCGMNLADLGADVIKIEPPDGDSHRRLGAVVPRESKHFQGLNRNKRGIIVDLHDPRGREVVHALVPTADVVITNYRLGVPERLGIDYETLRGLRPDLIYWQNTGFGEGGPEAARAGSDIVAQAYSGLMLTTGRRTEEGLPQVIPIPIADFAAGFAAAMGICAALYHRSLTGEGQYLSTSLLRAGLFLQCRQVMREPVADATQRDPMMAAVAAARERGATFEELVQAHEPPQRLAASFVLYYGAYQARDGVVVLGALTKANRDGMRRVLGLEGEDSDSPDYDAADPANVERATEWKRVIAERFRERTVAEWLADLDAAGVPAAPAQFAGELADDPQVQADGMMWDVEHAVTGPQRVVGPTVTMSRTPTRVTRAAPAFGEHTLEVLRSAGLDDSRIASLVEDGVLHARE